MNTNQKATNAYCGMMNKTFENIVGRVFLNSIPISKEELTPDVKRSLTNYAITALESAGGVNLLTNAIINETNPQRKSYLLQMFDVCDSTSKEVAERVAFEAAHGGKKVSKKTVKSSTTLVVNIIKDCVKELSNSAEMKTLFANNRGVKKCTKVTVEEPAVIVTVLTGDAADLAKFKGFLKKLNKMVVSKMPESAGNYNIKVDYNTASFRVTAKPSKDGATESVLDVFDFDFDMALEAGDDDVPDLTKITQDDIKKDEKSDDGEDKKNDEEEEKDDEDKDDEEDTEDDADADNKEDDKDDAKDDEPEKDKPKAEAPAITVRSLQTANIDTKMTDAEYEKFNKKVDSLDLATVSNIVNEKIVGAINDEKENYHQMDESNARLKDAIMKDDSVADDSAAESVMENILTIPKQKYQTEYQSLFSKLQLMAVESIALKPGIDMSKPDCDILSDITINSTFDVFNKAAVETSLGDTLDRAVAMHAALEGTGCDDCNNEKFIALGTAFATVIMTLLETLNTLGFINPSTNDVKQVVNNDTTVAKSVATISDDVANKVDMALENNDKKINGYKSAGAIEAVLIDLGTLKNKLLDATESGFDIGFDTFARIDEIIDKARKKLSALESAEHIELGYDLGNERRHNDDIIRANRVQKYVAAKKLDTAEFICTESANGITVDIKGYKNDNVMYHSSMALEGTHIGITAEDYVSLVLNKSNFAGMTGLRIRGNNKTIDL